MQRMYLGQLRYFVHVDHQIIVNYLLRIYIYLQGSFLLMY